MNNEEMIKKVVDEYMSSGQFDQLRRKLVADVDTKAAYQNTKRTMQNVVQRFLRTQHWRTDLNKNQLRDNLRKHLLASQFLRPGVSRIVQQAISYSVMRDVRAQLEPLTDDILGVEEKKSSKPEEYCLDSKPVEVVKLELPVDNVEMSIEPKQESCTEPLKEEKTSHFDDVGVPGEEVIKLKKSPAPLPMDDPDPPPPPPPSEEEPMHIEPAIPPEDLARIEQPMHIEADTGLVPDEMSEDESDEHSITNQMSPLSFGSLSPPPPTQVEPEPAVAQFGAIKRASDFVGKIPKLKRNEPSKDSNEACNSKDSMKKSTSSKHRNDDKEDKNKDKNSEKTKDRDRVKNSTKDKLVEEKKEKERKRGGDRSKDRYKDRSKERSKTSQDSDTISSQKVSDKDRMSKSGKEKQTDRDLDDNGSGKSKHKSRDKSSGTVKGNDDKSRKSSTRKGSDRSSSSSSRSKK